MAGHNLSFSKRIAIVRTQNPMERFFDVGVPAINKHLNNIFFEGELQPEATVSKMEISELINYREILGS